MLKAVIFDFDGVIANSEPAHFATFQRVLGEEGILITETDYYQKYLAMDDRGAFTAALQNAGREWELARVPEFIERKSHYFEKHLHKAVQIYADAMAFIKEIAGSYPLAINSGALRDEIEKVLKAGALRDYFSLIVSAEDITCCKPDPEGYLLALDRLNRTHQGLSARADQCLVIEDSVGGVKSAMSAGMKCAAVTNTYPASALTHATIVVSTLAELSSSRLAEIFPD